MLPNINLTIEAQALHKGLPSSPQETLLVWQDVRTITLHPTQEKKCALTTLEDVQRFDRITLPSTLMHSLKEHTRNPIGDITIKATHSQGSASLAITGERQDNIKDVNSLTVLSFDAPKARKLLTNALTKKALARLTRKYLKKNNIKNQGNNPLATLTTLASKNKRYIPIIASLKEQAKKKAKLSAQQSHEWRTIKQKLGQRKALQNAIVQDKEKYTSLFSLIHTIEKSIEMEAQPQQKITKIPVEKVKHYRAPLQERLSLFASRAEDEDPYACLELAKIRMRQNKHQEAQELLETALADTTFTGIGEAHHMLSLIEKQAHNFSRAQEHHNTAIERDHPAARRLSKAFTQQELL